MPLFFECLLRLYLWLAVGGVARESWQCESESAKRTKSIDPLASPRSWWIILGGYQATSMHERKR